MATSWKVADSLGQLRHQLNELAPGRSKASDGSIGDAAHASRSSDHNPWWTLAGQAYVTARDFTHDPRGGLDCHRLADALVQGRDPRVKYMIWDRRILAGDVGPSPWTWRTYSGANPHTSHLHLSVVPDARALSRIPWALPGLIEEDDMFTDADREQLYRLATRNDVGWARDQLMSHLGKHPSSSPLPPGELAEVEVARRVDLGHALDQITGQLGRITVRLDHIDSRLTTIEGDCRVDP